MRDIMEATRRRHGGLRAFVLYSTSYRVDTSIVYALPIFFLGSSSVWSYAARERER